MGEYTSPRHQQRAASPSRSPPARLPERNLTSVPLDGQGLLEPLKTAVPGKWKPEVFPTSIPSLLARAGPRERGQCASHSLPPAAEGKGTPEVSTGHHSADGVTGAGSKCPALFPFWLLKSPKFLPEGPHFPPRALPSSLPSPLVCCP